MVRSAVAIAIVGAATSAAAEPELRPGSAISADVVLCRQGPDCWLAEAIMPTGWVIPKRQVELLGVTGTTIELGAPITIASSQLTGDSLPAGAVELGVGEVNAGTGAVPVVIDKDALSPNHYVGIVRVSAPGATGPIDIPVDLRVRAGPLWPLLMLIFGVAVAWLARWRKEKGEKIERVLDGLGRLTTSIGFDPAASRAVLTPMLDRAQEAVTREDFDEAERITARIAERRVALAALERLARSLPGNKDIARARDMIARERDDQAKELIAQLEDLADAGDLGSFGVSPAAVARRPGRARVPEMSVWKKFKFRVLLRVLGPFLRAVLLLVLALLGLKELYVDGGADFGARPLYDYLALFFWGLGSEVATRSFDNVSGLLGGRARKVPTEPDEGRSGGGDDSGDDDDGDDDGDDDATKPKPEPKSRPEQPQPTAPSGEDGVVSLPKRIIKKQDKEAPAPFSRSGWPASRLDLGFLHDEGCRGRGVKIAVVDTGVARKQSEIDWNRVKQLDVHGGSGEDLNGHGTCMVSLLASTRGICPEAEVLSIRALNADGTGNTKSLIAGIEMAVANGCHVISISAGQPNASAALDAAVAKATSRGIVVIGAIRHEDPSEPAYPAASPGCTAVAPCDDDDDFLWGSPPDFVEFGAAGVSIPALDPDGDVTIDGSSPAAALTAGVCALLLSSVSDKPKLGRSLGERLAKTARAASDGPVIAPRGALQDIQESS